MKQYRLKYFITGMLIFLFISSCEEYMKQFDMELDTEVELHPSLAAPLVYGSFSLIDLLMSIDTTGLVELTEDSLMYLYYTDTAYSIEGSELIPLPNQITHETYLDSEIDIPAWGDLAIGEALPFYKQEYMDFQIMPGDQIDSLILREGFLSVHVTSEFRHEGILTISSPKIKDINGDTLIKQIPISQLDGNFVFDDSLSLIGYKIEVQEEAGVGVIPINFTLLLTKSANGVSAGEKCSISVVLKEMEFTHIYGFVAEREVINVTQSMEISFYEAVASYATVTFKDPQFNLYVHNSYGVPFTLNMTDSKVRGAEDKVYHDLDFEPGLMPYSVDAVSIDAMGETHTMMPPLEVNSETSNIVEIIEFAPDLIEFSIVANTENTSGGEQNFLLDTSKVVVTSELILPMWLKTNRYSRADTLDLDLEGILGDLDFVDTASVKLQTTNEMPFELFVQAYFLDASYQILDSLFIDDKPLLEAAPIDGKALNNELVITYTGEDLAALNGTKYMKLKIINASTTGADFVKFYSYYQLEYNVSIDANFILNTSDL